jgi:type I restriction enzyme, S subunit
MIDGLRPYPEMKATGLLWLGEVPAHWDVRRAKRILKPTETPVRPDDDIVTCFRDGQVTLRKNRRSSGFMIALLEQGYQGVRVGQLVVHSMDAFAGAIGISDSDGKCTPEYIVCDPREPETLLTYYGWLLRYVARTQYILAAYPAVRERAPRLRYPDLGELKLPAPPPDEQRLIVRFLDWHGGQTAKLIRAKKKIVALLNEQKQAIIHRAVTRGLDPNAKLKPSGIPWLGDVPDGWEVKKLKYLVRFNNGLAFKPSDWSNSGTPIIRIQNLNGSEFFNYTTKSDLPEDMLISNGDIVFSWSGNIGTSFGPFIWEREFSGYLNQHIFKVEKIGSHRRYFYYVLKAVTKHVEENTHGIIGLVHITKPELGSVSVPLAPFEEQVSIAGWLDEQLVGVNAVIDRAQREIALIQEFRTRLIADVVTGKLDVRAAGASLSEVTELEPIDGLGEGDDLDEAIDYPENEEVAA